MMLLTMVTRVMALSDEPVTATFPFNLGTEGQIAVFGDADSYFLGSKVTHGEGLWIKDKNNQAGFDETRFEPYSKNSNADATNEIRFIIQPKPGYTFTPTSVALKATRFGTDNGKINVAWLNADGTTMTLATAVRPNRNNGTNPANADEEGMKYSDLSYTVTGATPGEGACGLLSTSMTCRMASRLVSLTSSSMVCSVERKRICPYWHLSRPTVRNTWLKTFLRPVATITRAPSSCQKRQR